MTHSQESDFYKRHRKHVSNYLQHREKSHKVSDHTILRKNYQFIRDDELDEKSSDCWETRMSIKYYSRLFKEYALADLSRFKEGKVGLRWRTEQEVIVGKGQFSCGNKKCDERRKLRSYELLFRYKEMHEKKSCLVKVRVCPKCVIKIFYNKFKQLASKKRKHGGIPFDPDDERTIPDDIHEWISSVQNPDHSQHSNDQAEDGEEKAPSSPRTTSTTRSTKTALSSTTSIELSKSESKIWSSYAPEKEEIQDEEKDDVGAYLEDLFF